MTQKWKKRTLRKLKTAYCCKLNDGTGYIVWPERGCRPRGFELSAIGLGKTAPLAWQSAFQTLTASTQP